MVRTVRGVYSNGSTGILSREATIQAAEKRSTPALNLKSSQIPLPATTRLLFVTSELGEYIKAGGLGEVSSALPRALRERCDVRVLIPGYRQVRQRHPNMAVVKRLPGTAHLPPWSLGRTRTEDGLDIYVVLCDELYDRDGSPYGDASGHDFWDNDIRFARLSLAAAEIASGEADPNWRADILHVNDWPSALSLGYLRWKGLETPSILTVHNLAYQGLFDASRLDALGIPHQAFNVDGPEFYGKLSFLKSGIAYASHVTTVSETYAHEITTAEHGCGLDGLLRHRMAEGRLTGIVNGIDDSWSPPTADISAAPDWKRTSAASIRRDFGLAASRGPMFSIVSRLVHQKGIDLSIQAAETIVRNGGQIVVIGRGEEEIEKEVVRLGKRFPGQVGVKIGFDDKEARTMFAGSDFLLMPSRFEPCGLSQMYAQRLGSLPIAHKTGGLADTIDDGRSGFLFSNLSGEGLLSAVGRAFKTFASKPTMRRMRAHAMAKTFGWSGSAARYADVYAAARVA